jgi:DNA-binding beta-propeller fold protein YncE
MMTPRITLVTLALAALVAMNGCAPKKVEAPTFSEEEISWPPAPEPKRVRWLEHIANSEWAEPPSAISKALARLAGTDQRIAFKKPLEVTTDSLGRVFVSDTGWGGVLMFDKANKDFGWRGDKGEGALVKSAGLATDRRNHLFVSDVSQKRIHEYGPDGAFLGTIGTGILIQPVGLAVDEERGHLWVVDSRLHGVAVFDLATRTHVVTHGGRGTDDGRFNFPTNIVIGNGEAYVVDTFNFRVQVLDLEGKFLRKWGRNCDTFGCFSRAKGIGLDSQGNVYVADAAFNNVQIFNPQGELLMFFGGVGNGPGKLWLPAGLHVDEQDRVYVVSQYNWRVNVYQAFPVLPDGSAVAP